MLVRDTKERGGTRDEGRLCSVTPVGLQQHSRVGIVERDISGFVRRIGAGDSGP